MEEEIRNKAKCILPKEMFENIVWDSKKGRAIKSIIVGLNNSVGLTRDGVAQIEMLKSAQKEVATIWNGGD